MKILFTFLVFFSLGIASCDKECDTDSACEHIAYLLHPDYRDCVCCTGWYVKVNEDTFKVYDLPQPDSVSSTISKYGLPIKVELSYTDTTDMCGEDFKRITCFRILK